MWDVINVIGALVFVGLAIWTVVKVQAHDRATARHDRDLRRLRDHAHDTNGSLHRHGLYLEAIARKMGIFVSDPEDTPPEKAGA
jgi:hypothetical protein